MEQEQAKFNGWARVEVMGHQSHIGYVTTEAYGQAVLFRVDTPELPARAYVLESPEWSEDGHGAWLRAGTKVERQPTPGCTVLIGAGSIYRIVPCSEAAALKAIENTASRTFKVIELPADRTLAAAADPYDKGDDAEQDELDREESVL